MKILKNTALLLAAIGLFLAAPASYAFGPLEVTGSYGSATGKHGQNFNAGFGGTVGVYFDRVIDPAIPNFVTIGFHNFTLKADNSTPFRLVPILAGIELNGKVFSDLNTSFAIAAGGAMGWISATGASTSFNTSGYFAAQVKPGIQYMASSDIAIVARSPVTFLIGKAAMTYVTAEFGVQFKL